MFGNIIKKAFINSAATAAYVIAISFFLSHTKDIFGPEEPKTILVPTMMLLLLIISASITGFLVLGKPILWYLEGKKQEAISLFVYTISFLIIIALCIVFVLI